jgi:transcriptional regulator with XRE-family HTH domain
MYSKAMFAKQFKELIDKRGLTQRAVAERINTTETTISRYVSGDRTPNIETAVELASVLGVTLDVLVGADLPAAGRTPPDVNILVVCYEKASIADRQVLWSLLDRYMTPEQRVIITSMQHEEKADVG